MSAKEKGNDSSILKDFYEYVQECLEDILESRLEEENAFSMGLTDAYLDCLEYMCGKFNDTSISMFELEFKYNLK